MSGQRLILLHQFKPRNQAQQIGHQIIHCNARLKPGMAMQQNPHGYWLHKQFLQGSAAFPQHFRHMRRFKMRGRFRHHHIRHVHVAGRAPGNHLIAPCRVEGRNGAPAHGFVDARILFGG